MKLDGILKKIIDVNVLFISKKKVNLLIHIATWKTETKMTSRLLCFALLIDISLSILDNLEFHILNCSFVSLAIANLYASPFYSHNQFQCRHQNGTASLLGHFLPISTFAIIFTSYSLSPPLRRQMAWFLGITFVFDESKRFPLDKTTSAPWIPSTLLLINIALTILGTSDLIITSRT